MIEHTKGPWYRNINAKYPVYAGEAPNHVHIASILKGAPDDEREANLRLIAAAPELLEALEILLQETMYKDHPAASERALKVIAKAKGE